MKNTLLFLVGLFAFQGFSQNQWNRLTGFDTTNAVVWMDASNDAAYAITADRWIYKLDNGSNEWLPFTDVPVFYGVGSIKASKVSNRVFCLTQSSGIAFTDNMGASWQSNNLTSGGGNSGFGALILAYGLNGTTVLVSTIGPVSGEIQNNLWLSTNNGNTFSTLPTLNFYPTGFHFFGANHVLSNTANGIFRTSNLNSWTQIAFAGLEVTDLEVDGSVVFASVKELNGQGQVYKSLDGGQNWTLLSGLPANNGVSKLAYDAQNGRLFATTTAGVFTYSNSWTQVSANTKSHEIIVTGDQSALFSGIRVNGVHKISASTLSVNQVNNGLSLLPDLMCVSSDGQLYSASVTTSFLSKLKLDDLSWSSQTLFEELESTRVISMARTNDGQCLVGGMHFIAKTANQGDLDVIASDATAPLAPVYDILFPQKMFAGNDGSISMIQHSIQTDVDHSPDFGQTWNDLYQPTGNPGLMSIETVRSGMNVDYILGKSNMTAQNVVLASNNSGASWTTLSNPSGLVSAIFIDKTDVLYAVSGNSIYRLNGQNWVSVGINLGTEPNRVVEVAFDSANRMYVLVRATMTGFAQEGLYVANVSQSGFQHFPFSVDGGQTVRLKNIGFDHNDIPMATSVLANRDFDVEGIYYFSDAPYLGTPSVVSSEFVLYPNPASGNVNLSVGEKTIDDVELFTSNGSRLSPKLNGTTLDVSALSNGLYLIRIESEGKFQTSKLLVKH
ncbi:T9SS type A sorting domain-containing protein [Flavobacterium sp. MAH-1]|uniref:T9SS type A sorting domain-containing protein n=1 Tax=Flavobacterium agri TaxID=2743471 RepID=A0A7Y8Y4L4_9FLAO|nr:T9SS type A sorting domain-containing protein [Flavobacterium agri]NUY82241.1 T9SS type A sorting domain-containing protein [Flavobacterium agri]NYA72265.1 T9SS type A sorting domain-containing protein [Flavobacterium agri]